MILLTHGYFLEEDEKEQLIMKPYVPLGILYLSAYLETKAIKHEVFDSTFSTSEKFKTNLLEKKTENTGLVYQPHDQNFGYPYHSFCKAAC